MLPPGASIDSEGVWAQILRPVQGAVPRPALFLDRDGVIVEEVGHLRRPDDVRLARGASQVIGTANRANVPVVVVTNQSGIGRGLFEWRDFLAVQSRMLESLAAQRAFIDAVLACPHHSEARPPYHHSDHPGRKPNAGMILAAARLLPLLLRASWIIGDRASDLAAGRNAGLAGGLLVLSGLSERELEASQQLATATYRVFAGHSIAAALSLIPLLGGSLSSNAPAGDKPPTQARP
jgi:D-glycero-D-manno-heptose 1,7-bisphosphate phosphatase